MAVAVGAVVLVAAPAAAARTCFGKTPTVVGANRDPMKPVELNGTPGDDVIIGLKGWDIINARGGNDLVCGGGGDDFVTAGAGNDKVKGQTGQDTLNGNGGFDRMWGGRGTDSLVGGAGNDRLFGGRGMEDSLVGGAGSDRMNGGPGYDLAEFWDSPRGVRADLRSDRATGFGSDAIVSIEGLVGSRFDDALFGDEHSNAIRGGSGNDEIHAFGSSIDGAVDILRSDGGSDLLDGGEGPDLVSYNLQPVSVDASLATGEAVSADGFGADTFLGIEHLVGSKYDDVITGDAQDNRIMGNGGNDLLDGGKGSDEAAFFESRVAVTVDLSSGTALAPGWGDDSLANFENLIGSGYADSLVGSDQPNQIWGGGGGDSLSGLGGDDVLIGDSGHDDADGGEGAADGCDAESQLNCEIDLSQPSTSSASGALWSSLIWSRW